MFKPSKIERAYSAYLGELGRGGSGEFPAYALRHGFSSEQVFVFFNENFLSGETSRSKSFHEWVAREQRKRRKSGGA